MVVPYVVPPQPTLGPLARTPESVLQRVSLDRWIHVPARLCRSSACTVPRVSGAAVGVGRSCRSSCQPASCCMLQPRGSHRLNTSEFDRHMHMWKLRVGTGQEPACLSSAIGPPNAARKPLAETAKSHRRAVLIRACNLFTSSRYTLEPKCATLDSYSAQRSQKSKKGRPHSQGQLLCARRPGSRARFPSAPRCTSVPPLRSGA